MGCILRNDPGVNPKVGSFFGNDVFQIPVGQDHPQGFAGKDDAHGRFAGNEFIFDIIDAVGLNQRFLGNEQVSGLCNLGRIRRIEGIAEELQGNHEGIAGRILHDDFVLILFIPQDRPAVDRVVDHGFVIDDADGSPTVRHGIAVARVEEL